MKKILLVMLIVLSFAFTACSSKEGEAECKERAKSIYQKANDSTITRCIVDYNIKEKLVTYSFCINEDKTLYTATNNNAIGSHKVNDLGYSSTYNIYLQVEKELTEPYEGYNTFEFKPSELK